jgi:hypothetical protein
MILEEHNMKYEELKTKLTTEKHILPPNVKVVLDEIQDAEIGGKVWGIYEKDGVWYMYVSLDIGDEIQTLQADHGTEEEMSDAMYRRVLTIENNYINRLARGVGNY